MKYFDEKTGLYSFVIIFHDGVEKFIHGERFEEALQRNKIDEKDIKEAYGITLLMSND